MHQPSRDPVTLPATVERYDASNNTYELRPISKTLCAACARTGLCQQQSITQMFRQDQRITFRDPPFPLHLGDRVQLSIHAPIVDHAALLLYGLPLCALMLGAGIGHYIWQQDLLSIILGSLAFLAAFWRLRRHYRNKQQTFEANLNTFITIEPLHQEELTSCDTQRL